MSITKLHEQGFSSKVTLGLILEQDLDAMGVTMAQKRLILHLASPPAQPLALTEPTNLAIAQTGNGGPVPMTPELAQLLGTRPVAAPSTSNCTGERIDLNPLSYLVPKQSVKYHDIVDFVMGPIPDVNEEQIWSGGEGAQVVLKAGPKKPQLASVTPMQWSGANIRILMELLREGKLAQQDIFDYLAYTVKIAELAEAYLWQSVLSFDRAYRQRQAQMSFRWASDSPHLSQLHLRPRQASTNNKPQTNPAAGANKPKSNICRMFNRGECPFGTQCKYRHVCLAPNCQQSHPLAQHGKNEQKNTKGQD